MKSTNNLIKRGYARVGAGTLALGAYLASQPAFAQINVSAVTDEIADAKTAAMAIGAAVVLVFVGISLYKWVRRAL